MSAYTWLPARGTTGSYSGGPSITVGPGQTFSTIEEARDHIRTNGLNSDLDADIVVATTATLRDTDTIAFDEDDSGSNGHFIISRGTGAAGSATVKGSRVVSDWEHVSGSIYRSEIGSPIYTMWEDGVR